MPKPQYVNTPSPQRAGIYLDPSKVKTSGFSIPAMSLSESFDRLSDRDFDTVYIENNQAVIARHINGEVVELARQSLPEGTKKVRFAGSGHRLELWCDDVLTFIVPTKEPFNAVVTIGEFIGDNDLADWQA